MSTKIPEFTQVSLTELRDANKVIDENQKQVDLKLEAKVLKEKRAKLAADLKATNPTKAKPKSAARLADKPAVAPANSTNSVN